jgi:hypothetical protein
MVFRSWRPSSFEVALQAPSAARLAAPPVRSPRLVVLEVMNPMIRRAAGSAETAFA